MELFWLFVTVFLVVTIGAGKLMSIAWRKSWDRQNPRAESPALIKKCWNCGNPITDPSYTNDGNVHEWCEGYH